MHSIIFFFFRQGINMSNWQQNEIEQLKKDTNLLQDELKQLKTEERWIAKLRDRQNRIAKKKKIDNNKERELKGR